MITYRAYCSQLILTIKYKGILHMAKIKTKIKSISIKNIIPKNKYLLFGIGFLIIFFAGLATLSVYFSNRIYPGVHVLGIKLGGKKIDEAATLLSKNINPPDRLEFTSAEKYFELSLKDISFNYNYEKTVNQAYRVYRDESFIKNLSGILISFFNPYKIDVLYSYDSEKLDEYLQVVSEEVLTEPVYPKIVFENGVLSVNKGTAGDSLDKNVLLKNLDEKISTADYSKNTLPLKSIDPSLTDGESVLFKERAEKYLGKSFQLNNEYDNYNYSDKTILSFLDFHEKFSLQKITEFIEKQISPVIERSPQNAILRFEDQRVVEFVPAKEGLTIEKDALADELIKNLLQLEFSEDKSFSINIPVKKATPEVTLNEVNDFGIKELIGRGTSKFRGSIAGRIHNISLAASKFNGVLVAPSETLSFNNTLGDVSTFTGYKQAYIIKDGRTVLGDGGGVCQVSTTLFRAILDAGLPINERRPHSYRVSYYEQESSPGLDATVFSPTTDLKFTNDTPGYLLIQTEFDASKYSLVFEIYGTSDGRVSSVTKPIITSSIAPPEDIYIDDPTLPQGTVKQIDYKAWGAKVNFNYTVERNGEIIIDETYVSNYQPWQAVFLKGTGI